MGNKNDLDNDGGNVGGGGFAAPPSFVSNTAPQQPFQYPNIGGAGPSPNISAPPPFSYNIPPSDPQHDNSSAPPPYFPPEVQKQDLSLETPVAPGPSDGAAAKAGGGAGHLDLPELPPVPSDTPLGGNTPQDAGDDDDIDFDDLTKRFEALKKKK